MTVGTMIGSGIFISPTSIIGMSGSVGSALVIWVISGFIATISALCYIELGLLIHESGGEYSYWSVLNILKIKIEKMTKTKLLKYKGKKIN